MKEISFLGKYLKDAHLFYKEHCHTTHTILYESAEIIDKSGVQSLIGVSAALKVYCNDLKVTLQPLNNNGKALVKLTAELLHKEYESGDLSIQYARSEKNLSQDELLKKENPLSVMRALLQVIKPCTNIFIGGIIAFDFINNFEDLGSLPSGQNPCADYEFYVFDLCVRVNHQLQTTSIDAYAFCASEYEPLALKTLLLRDKINDFQGTEELKIKPVSLKINPDIADDRFKEIVGTIKEHIKSGDAFQVVPSRTFSAPCHDPLTTYAYLKKLNPSPYMYYIKDDNFTLFGASPEFALRFEAKSRTISISPIAGTRARGLNPDGSINQELDSRIELELRTDKKEVAEHLMLVDLARNDLARISKPGTRYVDNLLHVDKYQAVMHLVSDVHAILRDDLDALHAYCACMNMGTLSGAPKIKAHELIYRYEGKKRGSYGGVVAILSADGSFDSAIAIRSAYVKDKTAYVQAGCGVVFDSDEDAECQETVNKARSVLNAIALAEEA